MRRAVEGEIVPAIAGQLTSRYTTAMALILDQEFLPATLTFHPMTDDEFANFCAEHPELFFEMTAEGELVVMPGTYPVTGARNVKLSSRLEVWAEEDGRGTTFDSSTSFALPNGARRSPDASWVLNTRIRQLDPADREKFWHFCPDFVVELRSASDRLRAVRDKMREYIENGAQLGWLIDPEARTVEIYRPGRAPEILTNPTSLAGEGPVAGFVLNLSRIWDPLP
jgi:Uma2 family endonuclease